MFENTKGVVMLPSVRDFVGQNGCFLSHLLRRHSV